MVIVYIILGFIVAGSFPTGYVPSYFSAVLSRAFKGQAVARDLVNSGTNFLTTYIDVASDRSVPNLLPLADRSSKITALKTVYCDTDPCEDGKAAKVVADYIRNAPKIPIACNAAVGAMKEFYQGTSKTRLPCSQIHKVKKEVFYGDEVYSTEDESYAYEIFLLQNDLGENNITDFGFKKNDWEKISEDIKELNGVKKKINSSRAAAVMGKSFL